MWFNQAHLFHISSLRPEIRETLVEALGIEEVPRNVYFADGSPVPDALLEEVRGVLAEQAVSFAWEAGDVLMLDNMLVSHAPRAVQGTAAGRGGHGRAARQSRRELPSLKASQGGSMNAQPTLQRAYRADLLTHLRALAAECARETALTALHADTPVVITYGELDLRARALAAQLQARFAPGERALLAVG